MANEISERYSGETESKVEKKSLPKIQVVSLGKKANTLMGLGMSKQEAQEFVADILKIGRSLR